MKRADSEPGNSGVKISRRRFAGLAVASTLTIAVGSQLAAADAAAQSLFPVEPAFTGPWADIHASAAKLEGSEAARNKPAVAGIRTDLTRLEPIYEKAYDRAEKVVDLVERQKGPITLTAETQKTLGAMKLTPKDVIPFYKDKESLQRGKETVARTIEAVSGTITDGSATVSDRAEFYPRFQARLGRGADFLNQATGEDAKAVCRSKDQRIVLDPGIVSTPEGNVEFYADAALLARELSTVPAYRNVCSAFVISSPRYGEREQGSIFEDVNGSFSSVKPAGSLVYYGVHLLSRDPISNKGRFGKEMVAYHEAFGHGLSVFTSKALQGLLTPEQLVERATYEMQVLNNRDWAGNDGTLPEILTRYPRVQVEDYMANADKIDPTIFRGLIRDYPLARLLEPATYLEQDADGEVEAKNGSMFDVIWSSLDSRFLRPVKAEGLKPGYDSWGAFVADYMPVLADAASHSNARARILHSGLGEFKGVLEERVAGVADTSTEAWLDRVNIPVANAILYHLMLNGNIGGADLRNRLDGQEREWAEGLVNEKRTLFRAELWAEGTAYSHFFGTRLQGDPFRGSLEHIASMLS